MNKIKSIKKILIIGSCGAGKSTLAKKMHKKLHLPLIGLDQCYWKPNWKRTETKEWREKVKTLILQNQWIMDGNYKSTFDIRFPASDLIIFIDFNRFICFWRIWKRQLFKNRTDKLDGCKDKVRFDLMKWVLWTFPRQGRKEIYENIKKLDHTKKVVILKTSKDIKDFLNELQYN